MAASKSDKESHLEMLRGDLRARVASTEHRQRMPSKSERVALTRMVVDFVASEGNSSAVSGLKSLVDELGMDYAKFMEACPRALRFIFVQGVHKSSRDPDDLETLHDEFVTCFPKMNDEDEEEAADKFQNLSIAREMMLTELQVQICLGHLLGNIEEFEEDEEERKGKQEGEDESSSNEDEPRVLTRSQRNFQSEDEPKGQNKSRSKTGTKRKTPKKAHDTAKKKVAESNKKNLEVDVKAFLEALTEHFGELGEGLSEDDKEEGQTSDEIFVRSLRAICKSELHEIHDLFSKWQRYKNVHNRNQILKSGRKVLGEFLEKHDWSVFCEVLAAFNDAVNYRTENEVPALLDIFRQVKSKKEGPTNAKPSKSKVAAKGSITSSGTPTTKAKKPKITSTKSASPQSDLKRKANPSELLSALQEAYEQQRGRGEPKFETVQYMNIKKRTKKRKQIRREESDESDDEAILPYTQAQDDGESSDPEKTAASDTETIDSLGDRNDSKKQGSNEKNEAEQTNDVFDDDDDDENTVDDKVRNLQKSVQDLNEKVKDPLVSIKKKLKVSKRNERHRSKTPPKQSEKAPETPRSRTDDDDEARAGKNKKENRRRSSKRKLKYRSESDSASDFGSQFDDNKRDKTKEGSGKKQRVDNDIDSDEDSFIKLLLQSSSRKLQRRNRKPVPWSDAETEALKRGVRNHGVGNWRAILDDEGANLEACRTNVSLKDRWRNLQNKMKREEESQP